MLKIFKLNPVLLTALFVQSSLVAAISKLSVVGSKFFDEDGKQFFIKGIAYQLTPHDPLVQTDQCKRDASLMKSLGANAIRVYHVDPAGDHDGCMEAFADNGIYLFVDLDDFPTQINQEYPKWQETQFRAFKDILDEFQRYDNTAGVFVGNEVITTYNGSHAAPFVLSAARDVKAYRDSQNYRKIPVGYSAADIAELRPMLQNYFVCRPNRSETLDFFALNAYEWCGESSYEQSGYSALNKQAFGYPVPIFFSETGCNTHRPRDFHDLTAIFSSPMSDLWSGAIVYEWIQEANDYGLISYGKLPKDWKEDDGPPPPETEVMDGFLRQGTPTPVSPDFHNLQLRWETLSPEGVALSDYSDEAKTLTAPPCPKQTSGGWNLDPANALPELGAVLATTTSHTSVSKPTSRRPSTTTASTSSQTNGANHLVTSNPPGSYSGFSVMVGWLFGVGGLVGWLL
ncbi:hypothetical protein FQN57_002978 [Myotisia sp. PD_48]|nr:hypothetical protein FQN57_002978 [Myotisia sp. PD_48]